ncbi:hypothetical protein PCANC_08121 [Puccinia coronata f. sp. avenae]|uniref:Uncharacterized protein n=1 Tax=Puccinia coronata f. sp. avenae TaxID=200324 RepID=A0A2N5V3K1_9BASI|nr:hypothetical protein PCANC_25491 [Puccinia coronata f. sp. avenae]PLW07761.1 hypothetical protein PCASD_23454 [Puccinia coronata f. sp. avenae]PLW25549.1 hypothetical protein PCANC_24778 [Puccinia coronata f. sp. avenae]PLW28496.1 hypothetical protein PCASD_17477 [Puccinia coronata f. sp. avenae]PLW44561.1 hypothetical protein PCANC_08121 [Puccinia coronata f. sp. avenae]
MSLSGLGEPDCGAPIRLPGWRKGSSEARTSGSHPGPNIVRIEILNWLDSIAPVRQPVFALDHGLSWPRQLVDRWRTPVIEKLRVFIRALPKITQIHSNRVCLATYYTFQPVCALDNLEAWRTPVVEKGKSFYSRVLSGRVPPAHLAVLSQQSLLLFSNMVYS